uniref:Uncharacterized protein n=1 Tax=Rhipicephalus zambeziensis TaxID=60191 RepID=A0A224Y722_9ACAR
MQASCRANQASHSATCVTSGSLSASNPLQKAQPEFFIVISHSINKVHIMPYRCVAGTTILRKMANNGLQWHRGRFPIKKNYDDLWRIASTSKFYLY